MATAFAPLAQRRALHAEVIDGTKKATGMTVRITVVLNRATRKAYRNHGARR